MWSWDPCGLPRPQQCQRERILFYGANLTPGRRSSVVMIKAETLAVAQYASYQIRFESYHKNQHKPKEIHAQKVRKLSVVIMINPKILVVTGWRGTMATNQSQTTKSGCLVPTIVKVLG